jgi:hypothetical protein
MSMVTTSKSTEDADLSAWTRLISASLVEGLSDREQSGLTISA